MSYDSFAELYCLGEHNRYSEFLLKNIAALFALFSCKPTSVLDCGCGTGDFCIGMATKEKHIVGMDVSEKMIYFARKNAEKKGATVVFRQDDMRSFRYNETYDLVTCWYDTINHIISNDDLYNVFSNIAKVLNDDGYFIFDINTEHFLMSVYSASSAIMRTNSDTVCEIHEPRFDSETNICSIAITGFLKRGIVWEKFSETIKERAYSNDEIRSLLTNAGLEVVSCFEIIAPTTNNSVPSSVWRLYDEKKSPPMKLFFVCKKSVVK